MLKKGDIRDRSNYRGITLLGIGSKVYEQILENRLRNFLERQLDDIQSEFRKGEAFKIYLHDKANSKQTRKAHIRSNNLKPIGLTAYVFVDDLIRNIKINFAARMYATLNNFHWDKGNDWKNKNDNKTVFRHYIW